MKTFVFSLLVLATLTGVAMAQNNSVVIPTPNSFIEVLSNDKNTLFVGMDNTLMVVDVPSRSQIASVPIGRDPFVRPLNMCFSDQIGLVIALGVNPDRSYTGPLPPGVQVVNPNTGETAFLNAVANDCAVAQDGTVYLAVVGHGPGLVNVGLAKIDPTTLIVTNVYTNPLQIDLISTGDGKNFLLQMQNVYGGLYLATFDGSTVSTPQYMGGGTSGFWGIKPAIQGSLAYISGVNCFATANCATATNLKGGILAYDMSLGQFANFYYISGSYSFSGADSSFLYLTYIGGVYTYDISGGSSNPYFVSFVNPDNSTGNETLLVVRGQFLDTLLVLGGVTQHDIADPPASELLIWDVPRIPYVSSVVNSASFAADPIAANEWISALGRSLSYTPTVGPYPWPTLLDTAQAKLQCGNQSWFMGLYYASPNQINALTPPDMPTGGSCSVSVLTQNADGTQTASNASQVTAAAASPGVFAVTDLAGNVINDANPTSPGSVVVIYANALGPVQKGANGLMSTTTAPVVTVGGVSAQVLFSGLNPVFQGLYQVNLIVPGGLQSAGQDVDMTISIAGQTSPPAKLSVKQ